MSVRINTNIEALNAQRNLSMTATTFAKSVEKLSSGLRINRAADDAAGLGISEKLKAQVTGLNQAQRNAQDGISMVQTAEGALNEVHSMLQRMRELAVEASNSTLGVSDATSVNNEITALQDEINKIAGSTTFNGQNLLTGSLSVSQTGGTIQAVGGAVGAAVMSKIDVSGGKANTTYTLTSSATKLTLDDGNGHMQAVALGANSQTFNFDAMGVTISVTGTDTAANIGGALHNKTIQTGANSNANFQIGANAADFLTVAFGNAQTSAALNTAITNFTTAAGGTGSVVSAAQALITAADNEIGTISGIRGGFGAVQNRLEHRVASLGVASENLNASMSRIRDLDVASEMVNFTKTQILQQAGTAILAQANQAPQNILSLLR